MKYLICCLITSLVFTSIGFTDTLDLAEELIEKYNSTKTKWLSITSSPKGALIEIESITIDYAPCIYIVKRNKWRFEYIHIRAIPSYDFLTLYNEHIKESQECGISREHAKELWDDFIAPQYIKTQYTQAKTLNCVDLFRFDELQLDIHFDMYLQPIEWK